MDYLKWNEIIAKHFFNKEMAGREVLIYVNKDIINFLGRPFGGDTTDYVNAVKKGPDWIVATRGSFCIKAHQTYHNWRERGLDYPPYIAYLACFVLAATLEGDWDPKAFYPRLRKLLSDPEPEGTLPDIELMENLWKDLEKWSRENKKEEWGRFVARIRGRWCNVGLPWSQTIISEEERKNLNKIFDDANLDPVNMPSPEVIPRILIKYGQRILEKRTKRLLDQARESDIPLRDALVALVLEELEQWNGDTGTVPEEVLPYEKIKQSLDREKQKRIWLRICLNIDHINNSVKSYLRIKTNNIFPEQGLNFESSGDPGSLLCEEDYGGWSKKLKIITNGQLVDFNAASLNWQDGVVIKDNKNFWSARLRPQTTRLFLLGEYEGLYDWVENQHFERGVKFHIASIGDDIKIVEDWGKKSCDAFKEVKVSGLPANWNIFYGENARSSCDQIDVLALSSMVRLKIKGIQISERNTFLGIAPPKIIVENGFGNEEVTMNGKKINQDREDRHIWYLPNDAPLNQMIKISIENRYAESKFITLENPSISRIFENPYRDSIGKLCDNTSPLPKVGGVVIFSEHLAGHEGVSTLPTYFSKRIIFIGQRLGEICDWPKERINGKWKPVWAIAKENKKRWKVHYCGGPANVHTFSIPTDSTRNSKSLRMYKKRVYYSRKRINKPSLTKLRKMWEYYVEAAKNV